MDPKMDQKVMELFSDEEKLMAEVNRRAEEIEKEEPHKEKPFTVTDWIIIALTAVIIPAGIMVYFWVTAPPYY